MIRKHTLETSIILAVLIILLLTSCGGTRNTDTQQHENIVINNEYKQGEKIVLGNNFTYTPFNPLKGMVIDGKTYTNVVINNDKSITKTKWKNKTEYITKIITVYRTTKKTDNTLLYIGLFLVLIIGILAWFKLPGFRFLKYPIQKT